MACCLRELPSVLNDLINMQRSYSRGLPNTLGPVILNLIERPHQSTLHMSQRPFSPHPGSRVFYLGVVDASFNAGRPREGEVRRREYRLQLWQGQCLYWDQELDDWSSQGCKIISEHSSYYKAHCSCNHLTSFGAHFALSPNTLDFKNIDDFFDLHTNPVTFSFILAILITYGILMVIAVQKDNQDAAQPPIVELMDNSPSDKQKYLVSLETGFRKGAATTAKVSLVLHGEEGMSETRELVGRETKPIIFQRHSRQSFILTLPENLGRLFKCQIWHNNAGEQPSWYLSRVIVQDLNTGYFYYFMCERWFAADIGDGKVEREIMASEGGLGFSKVLWAKGTQYFADYHLWFSTFSRPPHSRFTRAQRLTCCLSLLMSYMALNCVWYKGTEKDYRGEFGMIDLSWRAVVVGAIISLIALPANLIIVMLFRRSKVNFLERPHSAFNKKYKTTKRNDSVSSIGSTDQSLGPPVMSPSLFDQTISNWQSLQDWAQKTWTRRNPDEEDSIDKKAVDTSTLETNMSDRIESVMKEETKDVTPPLASVELRKKANDAEIELRPIPPRHIKSVLHPGLPQGPTTPGSSGQGPREALRGRTLPWMTAAKVLLLSVIVAMRNRNNIHIFSHHDDGYLDQKVLKMLKSKPKSKEDDEDESVNLEEGVAARQRSRYLRFARPPQETELLKSRNDILKQKGASAFIKLVLFIPPSASTFCILIISSETLLFTVQFVLLVLIAFGKNPTHAFGIHRHVTATLAQDGEHPLAKVHSISQMWKWMQGHFTDTMYDDPTRPGFLSNSYLIGQVQLRQHRFTNQLCDVQVEKLLVSGNCRGDMEMDAFGMNQSYWYHSAELTGAGRVQGQHDDYGGDGYLVKLPNRRLPAEAQLKKLEEDGWVNSMTSAVIAEFTTFHVPSNIFNTVRILFEIPAFGGMTPSLKISSAYLYKYVSVMDNLLLACELLLIVCTMLKVRHEVMEMLRLKAEYFHNVWNALETSQCLLSLAFVGCFMFRFLLVGAKVQDLRSTYKEQFMDVSDVHEWDEVLRTIIGFILFLVTLQLVKALRHQPPFSVFAKVYHRAAMDILVFALMFFIWLASYTCLTMALYSALSMQFKSVDNTILSLLALLTGSYDFDNLAFGNFWGVFVWRLVIVSFMMFVIGSLTAYMLAILNYHYKRHHSEKKVTFNLTESVRFCRNRLSNVFRLRAASSEDPPSSASASASGKTEPETLLPTEFTMAEIEYQVDEMLFKMNALAGTSNLPEKPPIYYTDSDTCIYGGVGGSGEGDSSTTASSEVQGFNPLQELRGNHKIEYIFSEPHLSKLLQLDSIGADVLNVPEADVEKQLRNQLEMEIFRQLQLQRQEGRYPSSSGSGVGEGEGEVGGGEGGVVGVGERGSEALDVYASSLSSSGCNHSPTPASVGGAKSHTIDESDSVTCNDPLPILNSIPFHPEPPAPPQVKPSAPHSIGGRKLQQRKDKKKKKKKVHSASSSEALVVEEMPDSVIGIRSDSADSSSCCSGSHKAANRGNSLHPGMPVPPLHPCSNTTPAESKRAAKSKKSSQAQLHKKTPVPQYNEGGLNQILNSWDDLDFSCSTSPSSSPSSSSSESEEQTPPAQSKAQQHSTRGTLRKTRSRGGGKGQGHAVAACDLLSLTEDEFAFDNHGYASEGDRVRAGQKKYRKPPPPATKQCWS
ncbi:hypothetical protein CAPTEDRAFT_228900 [Capitella teleta]|uniref:PLAT domain-containing protein n=1 Tax=Capitella teleta TaxID=283909 RepID=R7URK3_CAPTE|nr:hypothetical protein CAPTEDRAFT_228900 [Capitella teleta]|eukprot:ELU08773.1 hypothetical protein CAPTEDRAFT_228900 [Capitella teleta]